MLPCRANRANRSAFEAARSASASPFSSFSRPGPTLTQSCSQKTWQRGSAECQALRQRLPPERTGEELCGDRQPSHEGASRVSGRLGAWLQDPASDSSPCLVAPSSRPSHGTTVSCWCQHRLPLRLIVPRGSAPTLPPPRSLLGSLTRSPPSSPCSLLSSFTRDIGPPWALGGGDDCILGAEIASCPPNIHSLLFLK